MAWCSWMHSQRAGAWIAASRTACGSKPKRPRSAPERLNHHGLVHLAYVGVRAGELGLEVVERRQAVEVDRVIAPGQRHELRRDLEAAQELDAPLELVLLTH